MTSRLRRMLLVNIRSSGTMTSGAINEIDPRGGAAVTGDNGAGKTTTLQLLPIFFGTPPSQIVQPGGNRDPMLRFVLPDPACAIVYEYQRGDHTDDIRCVVVRREDGGDAAEYRFIEGPFRREFFVGTVGDEGPEVFLDDSAMCDAARRHGLTPDRKLNASQYRTVILRLRSNTHDAESLRRLAAKHSFSLKSLAHLDKLITAVVKERIDFRDFTHVAVAMAQSPAALTSASNAQGGASERLSLRQGREQIDRWLRNRDNCASALALAPLVGDLRQALSHVAREEQMLRERRADVLALIDARNRDVTQEQTAVDALKAEDARLTEEEATRQVALDNQTKAALKSHAQAKTLYETAEATRARFEAQQASLWAEKVVMLPSLRAEERQLQQQIGAAAGTAGGIEATYATVVTSIEKAAAHTVKQLQGDKRQIERDLSARLEQLGKEERDEAKTMEDAAAETREKSSGILVELSTRIGELQTQQSNPVVDPSIESEALESEAAFEDALDKLRSAEMDLSGALRALQAASSNFECAELGVSSARETVRKANSELEAAKGLLDPADGSLIAALRGCGNDEWRHTLAKILDPALLHNATLKPRLADEDAATSHAFGWSLELGSIPTPEWTDDAELRRRVQNCADSLQMAMAIEAAAIETRVAAGKARTEAEVAHQTADAAYGVASRRFNDSKGRRGAARAKRTASIEYAKAKLTGELEEVRRQMREHKRREEEAAVLHRQAKQELRRIFVRRMEIAKSECGDACGLIDEAIRRHEQSTAERVAAINLQRDEELKGNGVDVAQLDRLRKRLNQVDDEVGVLESKMALVDQWRAWTRDDGPARADLAGAAEVVERNKANAAMDAASQHFEVTQGIRKSRSTEIGKTVTFIEKLQAEVAQLKLLDEQFQGYGNPPTKPAP